MINRAHRFHGYNSLRFVYRQGQTERGQLMSLRYCPNSKRQTWRLAVVVSKKVSKSAVQRNRIRRRIYEVVRLQAHRIDQPYDLVITVFQNNLTDLPAAELSRRLTELLARAHVIIEPKESPNV